MGVYVETKNPSITVYRFSNLLNFEKINHFISNRKGGLSKPPYEALNIGFNTADDEETVLQNRALLGESIDIPMFRFTFADQTHSGNVTIVTEDMKGRGSHERADSIPDCDGLVTNVPGICLMTMMADCVPVLMYDPVKNVIGISHAGWRGIIRKVTKNTVARMIKEFGSKPEDIIVGIGPSIGPCCYEIGEDVEKAVKDAFDKTNQLLLKKGKKDKKHLDLWKANIDQLNCVGIPLENIEMSKICTSCSKDIYFSSRMGIGITGRFAAGIMIKE
jgi:polyphenol oxidase